MLKDVCVPLDKSPLMVDASPPDQPAVTPNQIDFTKHFSSSCMPRKVLFNNNPSHQLGSIDSLPGGSPTSAKTLSQKIRPSINTEGHSIEELIKVGLKYINGCPDCQNVRYHRSMFSAADYMKSSGGGHVIFKVRIYFYIR